MRVGPARVWRAATTPGALLRRSVETNDSEVQVGAQLSGCGRALREWRASFGARGLFSRAAGQIIKRLLRSGVFQVGTPTPRGDRRARLWTSTDMSHFPGRAPPAPPSGFDDSGLDMRAIKQAGGKVLPGEHSQIAKLQKPNRFIPPSAPRSPSARPLTTHPDSYHVNPQAATV